MTTQSSKLILSILAAAAIGLCQGPGDRARDASTAGRVGAENAPQAAKPRQAGLVVGVVDFAKVLDTYSRAIEGKKQIDAVKQTFQGELDEMQKRAKDAELLRDNFQPGSREWYEKDLAVKVTMQTVEGRRQIFENELRRKREEFYVAMLEDMQRAVAIVAKEKQVSLVLRVHEDLIDGTLENKARVFESRIVWFAADEVDLTPDVIKLLRVPLPPVDKADGGAAPGEANTGTPNPGK